MPEGYEFQPGRAVELRAGGDVTIVATGTTVSRALEAASSLDGDGVSARVLAMPTIKALDGEALLAAAHETAGIVTVEEALTSGLGGAVAEDLAPRHPTLMRFVGVPDTFAPTGSVTWLMEHFGISPAGTPRQSQKSSPHAEQPPQRRAASGAARSVTCEACRRDG